MEIRQPFFSVIVPTTGGRLQNLELVLTSLSNQYFPKQLYEVIVVNDGGEKQEPYNLCKEFAEKFSRLCYLRTERFQPLDFDSPVSKIEGVVVEDILDSLYDGLGNTVPNVQPRNKGTIVAKSDFFIFADSDIILAPTALSLYFQDMMHNPNRIVLGVYHWLYPMHVTPEDILTRFDDIINEHISKYMLSEIEPTGVQSHNICRDYRMADFRAFPPDTVFQQPGHINHALSCFSGNICWPRAIFEAIGGYTPYLAAGAHEDGYSGIDIYKHGYGISFDGRIIGGHLYHPRNVQWVEDLKWKRGEIMWLNQQHADCPEMTGIIELTNQEMERLGVGDWKEKGKLGW